MKAPPFAYCKPATLSEAIDMLAGGDNVKILAGGQSLISMLNLRYIFPDTLVDINDLHELAGIDVAPDRVRIGAMTRQRHMETNDALHRAMPILREALRVVGHRQTRNRGTLGGSLCHLDPAAELPTLALLHDAEIEVAGPGGQRSIGARDFIVAFMTPGIASDEIVTAVRLARWGDRHGYGFQEFSRRHGDFALASAAVLIECDDAGTIERCAIAIGGLGSVPQRLPSGEAALAGSSGGPDAVAAALDACGELETIEDFHAGAEYRLSVARAMLHRALTTAIARAGHGHA